MQIQKKVSLKAYNTFGVDVEAKYLVEIENPQELIDVFAHPELKLEPLLILGAGSNMLFVNSFEGLVLKMCNTKISVQEENEDTVLITAGAGTIWNTFVNYCVSNNYFGVENLALIPGTVGASPVQNVGAYGVEIKDVLYECTAFEISTQKFKTYTNRECEFSYRESIFKGSLKGQYIITSVTYKLSKVAQFNISYGAIQQHLDRKGIAMPSVKDIATAVSEIRVEKLPDPSTIGSAGSFFKNPIIPFEQFQTLHSQIPDIVHYPASQNKVKLAAAWLIEQCGWKGKSLGEVAVWKHQALVIVNQGKATGKEIFDFSEQITNSVNHKFGVKLEREVNVIA